MHSREKAGEAWTREGLQAAYGCAAFAVAASGVRQRVEQEQDAGQVAHERRQVKRREAKLVSILRNGGRDKRALVQEHSGHEHERVYDRLRTGGQKKHFPDARGTTWIRFPRIRHERDARQCLAQPQRHTGVPSLQTARGRQRSAGESGRQHQPTQGRRPSPAIAAYDERGWGGK